MDKKPLKTPHIKEKKSPMTIIIFVVLIIYFISLLIPIIWATYSAFNDKTAYNAFYVFNKEFPTKLTFDNFVTAFTKFKLTAYTTGAKYDFLEMIGHSILYTLGCAFFYTLTPFEEKNKDRTDFEDGRVGVQIHITSDRSSSGDSLKYSDLNKDIYFTENVDYYYLTNNNKFADITDIMTTPNPEDDNKKIVDKIDENLLSFMERDGKYYAVPFYDCFYGLIYDKDLFKQKSFYMTNDGQFTNQESQFGTGPNGVAGDWDDGLPKTYAQFKTMMDIVTLEDEFHFYENNKSYSMSFHPVAVEFTNGDFVGVANIYSRLLEKLNSRYDLDDYDDDKVPVVQGLLSQASTAFNNASSMRALWEAYYSYMEQLDEVPLSEEKMAEKLRRAKEAAIAELNAYINENLYDEEHLEIVTNYVNTAIAQINAATTVQEVNQILAYAKTQIDAVETKQVSIEQKIMSLTDGYEQYLAKYDVATLSDLSAIGDVHIYPKDSALESESFGTDGNPDAFNSRIATSDDNRDGNMIFKFKYSSTNPMSSMYGAQLFIRLRGTASNTYVFHIAAEIEGAAGVRLGVLEKDAIVEGTKVDYRANFAANTEYVIECGAIDLKEFDRTFIFIKIDGTFVAKLIVDNIKAESKPAVMIMDSYTNPETSDTVTLSSVEEGTTKADNAALLGRMILDNASNGDSLITTLRENTVPVNTRLYPATNDAITINGNPIAQNRSDARI